MDSGNEASSLPPHNMPNSPEKGSSTASSKLTQKVNFWDPFNSKDWNQSGPFSSMTSARIKRDISVLFQEPLPGIFIFPDETNYYNVICLIVGPLDTPYEGGMFKFIIRFGPSYPLVPPRVRFLTTGSGTIRFNPNFYKCGKVCLSILGTFSGPGWSPVSTLGSLLLTLQSLMNEMPYYNEPLGYNIQPLEHKIVASDKFNKYLIHETIRVTVCEYMERILKDDHCNEPEETIHGEPEDSIHGEPEDLILAAKSTFHQFYDKYLVTCNNNISSDNLLSRDMYGKGDVKLNYTILLKRLKSIKDHLNRLNVVEKSSSDRDSLSSLSEESDDDLSSKCNE